MKYIYCSGPLFCPEEIAGMSAMARILEDAGFTTFLPHRDGIERLVMGLVNTPFNTNFLGSREIIDKAIFALDVFQIVKRCDCLVLNMNGRVPDEGAVAEAGIAFASGKPVVIYKNDARTIFKGRDNSMITGLSGYPVVRELNKLPGIIKHLKPSQPELAGRLLHVANYGEKIWSFLKMLPSGRLNKKQQEDMINDIIKISENSGDN
jgi:nucleoside 2-deoxyribosyltransferase